MPYVRYVENPPATFATPLASQDVFANPGLLISALSGGGGGGGNIPPSGPPGVPEVDPAAPPNSNSIQIQWSTLNVTGKPTPLQYAQYASSAAGPYTALLDFSAPPGYNAALASDLSNNTPYYFQSVASNAAGVVSSSVALISTTVAAVGPNQAPAVPDIRALGQSTATVHFSASGVTGVPTPTYVSFYGLSDPPTTAVSTTRLGGTDEWQSELTGLTPGTPYYTKSGAYNSAGLSTSAVHLFSTTGGTPSNAPPNQAPTVPIVVGTTSISSISVSFDTAGITGTPTPTYYTRYGTTPSLTEIWSTIQNVGTQFRTSQITSLQAGTGYYFQSLASNSSGALSSAVAVFSTLSNSTPPAAPSPAPGVPNFVTATNSSITVNFTATTTGSPTPAFSTLYGAALPLSNTCPTVFNAGVYTSQVSSLQAGSNYYFQSLAWNSAGLVSSPAVLFSSFVGPNIAPSIPALVSANPSSITFSFSSDALSGIPVLSYSALYGSANPPTTVIPSSNLIPPGAGSYTYTGTVSTLTSGTNYYFRSVAYNVAGTSTSVTSVLSTTGAAPPAPTINYVSTILGVGFLSFNSGGFSSITLNTSQNASVGNWQADGSISYSGTPPGGITGPEYLSTLQAAGNKIVLSLGGATDNPSVLSSMFGLGSGGNYNVGAANLADSLAYAYFGGPAESNPLGFANTNFQGFTFDGLDLDLEAVTPSTTTLKVFVSTLKANPGFANKIITAAPQTPYLSQSAGSALNANGTFASFSEMNPGSVLNQVYTGNAGNQASLLSPTSGNLIDYQFIQCYNNASYSYPTGPTNSNWNNVVAAWGIQSLQSGYPGAHPKNIYAFATTDGTPIFDAVADSAAFNTSLSTANSTIRAFSTTAGVLPYSSVTVADWCAGIGFWAANTSVTSGSTSLPVLSTVYGQPSTLNNMPTKVCMTYGGVFNANAWGFVGGTNVPVPNARGY